MILKEILLFIVAITVTACAPSFDSDDPPDVVQPTDYTVSFENNNLHSGIIERMQVSKRKNMFRYDFNGGDNIKIYQNTSGIFQLTYYVRPESDKAGNVIFACRKVTSLDDTPEFTGIPDIKLENYVYKGIETISGKKTLKYSNSMDGPEKKVVSNFWLEPNTANIIKTIWIPVRLEKITYDTWFAAENEHSIWNFYNFESIVNDTVFDYELLSAKCLNGTDDLDTKHFHLLNPEIPEHVDKAFLMFKIKHNKTYADEAEHSMRRGLFHQSMKRVIERNRQNKSYTLAINKFADMTVEEKTKYMGCIRGKEKVKGTLSFPYSEIEIEETAKNLSKEYDLRIHGYVSRVKNQFHCGSCWAFATTATVEGALARTNGGRLMHLSQQALMDCSWAYGNNACDGGLDTHAYNWMIDHGLPSEEEYGPYTNVAGMCKIASMTKIFPIRGFGVVPAYSNSALKIALINHGPLTVQYDATDEFISYSGGILYDTTCSNDAWGINHEVSLVGYGEKDGAGFWIIKNSWGPEWGIEGYAHISVDKPCGITAAASYVVMK